MLLNAVPIQLKKLKDFVEDSVRKIGEI